MSKFDRNEWKELKNLRTPRSIQDFLDAIPMNFEEGDETCMSPLRVLRERRAHCMEGAMLAAVALRCAGFPPLVVDLKASPVDFDHVITVFGIDGFFGAISKTNHGVLRYREPVYATIRELAMSYFHEYTSDDGRKTLRSYSRPVDLSRFDARGWMMSEEDVWYVPEFLDDVRHFPILNRRQIAGLRKADPIERRIGAVTEWAPKQP
ncbi:hypothetical protein EXS70_04340 [Candidatus Peribacteria bacterium]|nr:hypothetical protein [Candidatus Peribacteria bacterium]